MAAGGVALVRIYISYKALRSYTYEEIYYVTAGIR